MSGKAGSNVGNKSFSLFLLFVVYFSFGDPFVVNRSPLVVSFSPLVVNFSFLECFVVSFLRLSLEFFDFLEFLIMISIYIFT